MAQAVVVTGCYFRVVNTDFGLNGLDCFNELVVIALKEGVNKISNLTERQIIIKTCGESITASWTGNLFAPLFVVALLAIGK